ncbi:uncharacterized protein BDR25DRAFT_124254 [Lindgomyces ingoldianus]|uniref:Uncharacterized protein n=1 Tax=Lindgomyces ingoldianus TaxID=673940 RepID=A0ACB6R2U7_9PLEO|nr:uncharacterized protein BDR25DRAFT_124254 [Lindgomyces ingoldianus]KAF2473644.1 hypothetical protein BDR25DRAFT_124254 [Lindgomyces ingoldianus]
MKRRRSLCGDSDGSQPELSPERKLAMYPASPINTNSETAGNQPNETPQLLHLLTQYSTLECLAAHLFAKDLLSLASTSRAAHQAMLRSRESTFNLLKKASCDGSGVRIRRTFHQKSRFFHDFDCLENTRCGTDEKNWPVASHPCISCGVKTCQECRTHCVYQNCYQPADEEDELPNYSGHVLLSEHEMSILSPEHLGETGSWTSSTSLPHHDEGFLDSPLDSGAFSGIELIDDIIDTNLGKGELKGTDSSDSPHPSAVIQAFWELSERRKRILCKECFEHHLPDEYVPPKPCCCTFRSRFLDRWLCLKCYQREERFIKTFPHGLKVYHSADYASVYLKKCTCGGNIDGEPRVLCLWCWGEVGANIVERQDGATKA